MCFGTTSGPCQGSNTVCPQFLPGTEVCPPDTQKCECPACAEGSSGPCHGQGGSCVPYMDGTTTCPYFTFECGVGAAPSATPAPQSPGYDWVKPEVVCPPCFTGTFGPCQQPNTVCDSYYEGTVLCPAGTVECSGFDARPSEANVQCSGCFGTSSGSCQAPDGVCWDFFPGTSICPAGTYLCGLIIRQNLDQGQVEAFDRYRSYVVVVIVLAGVVAVAINFVILVQCIICRVLIIF